MLLYELGRTEEALAALRRGRDIVQHLANNEPSVIQHQSDLVASDNNIGLVLRAVGRTDQALQALKQGRETLRELTRAHPSVTEFRNDLATNYVNSGDTLAAAGRAGEARGEFEQALIILRQLADEHPSVEEYRRSLAITLYNLGDILGKEGQIATALDSAENACRIMETLAARSAFEDFVLALSHDLCADLVVKRSKAPSDIDLARRTDHLSQAMTALRRATDAGYRAFVPEIFTALRSKDDFKLLIMDLTMPANPFADQ